MLRSVSKASVLILAGWLAAPTAGCDGDDGPSGPAFAVKVRVRNVAPTPMEDVVVTFPYPGGETRYGDLEPGQVSGYVTVEEAYRYAAIRVVVNGDTLRATPIDYVGETPLPPGRHTYRLGLFEGRSLTLELE